jgi:hypothetical protein
MGTNVIKVIDGFGLRSHANFLMAVAAILIVATGPGLAEAKFTRIETQYIAALGEPGSTSGDDAHLWGLWAIDPGPRGVRLRNFEKLKARAGLAPAGWQFDSKAWWLEENGLIMEAPSFPVPPGQYVVTGNREVTSVLTVGEADATGRQAWKLSNGTTIYDVTHLRCRAARYSAINDSQSCSPDKTPANVFPMSLDRQMPFVDGCSKQDYQVLIVIGMIVEE